MSQLIPITSSNVSPDRKAPDLVAKLTTGSSVNGARILRATSTIWRTPAFDTAIVSLWHEEKMKVKDAERHCKMEDAEQTTKERELVTENTVHYERTRAQNGIGSLFDQIKRWWKAQESYVTHIHDTWAETVVWTRLMHGTKCYDFDQRINVKARKNVYFIVTNCQDHSYFSPTHSVPGTVANLLLTVERLPVPHTLRRKSQLVLHKIR